jgi:hypothetical protein
MSKKKFLNLEEGNKNMGGVSALFTPPAKPVKEVETVKVEDLDKTRLFSLAIPIEGYQYLRGLAALKTKQGDLSYNLKAAFLEGLELLKKNNPLVDDKASLERRLYRGGGQKNKVETYNTSVNISKREINWIDNYILQERQKDEFFSKPDFINNLIEQLKKKYGKSL